MAQGMGGSATAEVYNTVASDLRSIVESLVREEIARRDPFLCQVGRSVMAPAAEATRGFGFAGERMPPSRKQLTAARRFSSNYDYIMYVLDRAVANRELKARNPAWWRFVKRTRGKVRAYVRSAILMMAIQGTTERAHTPLIVQSDIYSSLMRVGQSAEERERLALMEQAGQTPGEGQGSVEKGVMSRIDRALGLGKKRPAAVQA